MELAAVGGEHLQILAYIFLEQFAEFKELKNIDKTTMISVLEESFRNVLAKMFGTDENLDVSRDQVWYTSPVMSSPSRSLNLL